MKAILTTGFNALTTVLVELFDAGYEIVQAQYLPEDTNMECAARYMPEELYEETRQKAHNKTMEIQKSTMGKEFSNIPSIGGKRILEDSFMSDLFFHHVDAYTMNAYREMLKYYDGEFDIVGTLVHMENGVCSGTIADYALEKGIPHFCIHNGIAGDGAMIYSSLPFYGDRLHTRHYIPGKWTEEFINNRYKDKDVDYLITGHNNFDKYYKFPKKTQRRNFFLYIPSTSFRKAPLPAVNHEVVISDSMYSWSKRTVSFRNDMRVFRAIAKYQREVDPEVGVLMPFKQFIGTWKGNTKGLIALADMCGVKNVKTTAFGKPPLSVLINDCAGLITPYSTVIIEGIISRTPTLAVMGDRKMFEAFGNHRCYLDCTNDENELFIQLLNLTNPQVRKKLVERCDEMASYYNYDDDGKATERIVEDMIRRIK